MKEALIYGITSGIPLVLGAYIGIKAKISKFLLGIIMGFGAGYLISTLSFDLMEEAFLLGGFIPVSFGFAIGILLFVAGDYVIDEKGGHNRKKAHGKNLSVNRNNSGYAILLGAILDGIPEAIAIGIGIASQSKLGTTMLVAVVLSNLPEGISGAKGMKLAGRTNKYIIGAWSITLVTSILGVLIGYLLLGNATTNMIAFTLSISAGAILAMIGDTMIPDAFDDGGRLIALATGSGFLLSFIAGNISL